MKAPKTINTDTRIFKIITFEDETFLCNLRHITLKDISEIKHLWHLWNFEFKRFGKIDLKEMIILHSKK